MKNYDFAAESQLRKPSHFIHSMVRDLWASKQLALILMFRDIRANYRQTYLGYLWAFLPSLTIAFGLVAANNSKVINIESTNIPYPAYVVISMILWQTFVEAFNGPLQAITESRSMLVKINFPKEAIILAKMGEVIFNFCIKLILLIAVYIYYEIPINSMVLLAPFGILSLIIFGTVTGLFLAPIAAVLQDFSKAMTVFTTGWLFITPVVFPCPKTDSFFSKIVMLNPVTHLLVTTRELATSGIVSNWNDFIIVSTASCVAMLFTWIFFKLAMPFVVERMPS